MSLEIATLTIPHPGRIFVAAIWGETMDLHMSLVRIAGIGGIRVFGERVSIGKLVVRPFLDQRKESEIVNKGTLCFHFVLTFSLLGCQINASELERTTLTINGQHVELVTTYALFDNYLAQQVTPDIASASNQLIYEPLYKDIVPNAEAPFMFETIRTPYQPNDLLRQEVDLLRGSDLLKITEKALSAITSALPGPDTKIIFMPANPSMHEFFVKHTMCMNAVTIGSGKIVVMIDPTFTDWQRTLPYVIAHEYHHSTWISKHWVNADLSLLEYLIFEGRADAFARSLYSDVSSPWTTMIGDEQEKTVWHLIEPEIHQRGHERINRVMFGDQDIPLGSGYTIGFNIVRSFTQHNPGYSIRSIIDLKPEDILTMSRYQMMPDPGGLGPRIDDQRGATTPRRR
jgi:uncharacterized protein YjaZ